MTTSPIPKVRDDDPEDVSWALSTAASQFARGDHAEALKWLRRAAEAASEAERDSRALEIAKAAAELSPPSVVPPPPQSKPPPLPPQSVPPSARVSAPPPSRSVPPPLPPSSSPSVAPRPQSVAPRPPSIVPKPVPTPMPTPRPSSPAPKVRQPSKPTLRSSPPPQPTKRSGLRTGKPDDTAKKPAVRTKARALPADEKTETNVITEVTKLDAKPPHADADAWPTESMDGEDFEALGGGVYGQERTRIGPPYKGEQPPQKPFRASQAVHVVLWRDPDGTLRVAPRGTAVSAVTIEALLVAPGPDVDLIAWLSTT